MTTRDEKIDILKTIGLLGIIIAHSRGIPAVVNYLRNFEVSLLVIVSGVLYARGTTIRSLKEYRLYLKKRSIRLVIPTWIFLSCFLVGLFIMSKVFGESFPYDMKDIVDSYLMINGIGYVWIMLVYLLIACGLPCLSYFVKNHRILAKNKITCLVTVYLGYEILRYILVNASQTSLGIYYVKNIIPYLIIYTLIAGVGFWINKAESNKIRNLGIGLLIIHVLALIITYLLEHTIPHLNTLKFPPSFIYLTYAIGASFIIISVVMHFKTPNILKRVWRFIGKNSQWIYLNHIYFIFIWNEFIDKEIWYLMAIFCFLGSCVFTFIQVNFVRLLFPKTNNKIFKFINIVLG